LERRLEVMGEGTRELNEEDLSDDEDKEFLETFKSEVPEIENRIQHCLHECDRASRFLQECRKQQQEQKEVSEDIVQEGEEIISQNEP
jgi:hypothetical protein